MGEPIDPLLVELRRIADALERIAAPPGSEVPAPRRARRRPAPPKPAPRAEPVDEVARARAERLRRELGL